MDREEYVERVLALVEQIPPGRVMSYGAIAEVVGVGGPRQVGRVMSLEGGPVPWWRVVRADGGLPLCHDGEARERHRAEGTPMRSPDRVDIQAAHWWPDEAERDGGRGFVGRL
ncbi:MAG TPA: MGMT family protein [Nocardioidaceae bacterium]